MGNRDIIVIGGSSGATAPLKEILRRIPADLPAAVFVVLYGARAAEYRGYAEMIRRAVIHSPDPKASKPES